MPLNLTDFNQFYVINKICGQEKQRHYLESLGFVPGARISILSELHGYYQTYFPKLQISKPKQKDRVFEL